MPLIARGRIVVSILTVFWICLIAWFEYFRFAHEANQCPWPDHKFLPSTGNIKPHHVLVIADPQILDHRSYPERGVFLSWITRLIVDINMRKNWWAASSKKPDTVVFLGDMLDSGRFDMSDAEYESYVGRFNRIFNLDPSIPKYYIPGNHDTGLGIVDWFSPERYTRYTKHFGKLNYELNVANHSLIFIDAPGFADEDHKMTKSGHGYANWKAARGGAIDFIAKYKNVNKDPVILLTHIPLYRPDGNGCGRLREHGMIRPGGGVGYQNTLSKDGSQKLLEALHPSLILSGDDHDYCHHEHFVPSSPTDPNPPNAKEISVKSLSMAMGIKRPGFQLLSLAPPALRDPAFDHKPNDDAPCLLPDQMGIYIRIYLPVFVLTLAAILVSNLCCWRSKRGRGGRHRLTRSGDVGERRSPVRFLDVESYLPSPVSASDEKGFNKKQVLGRRAVVPTMLFCFFPRTSKRSALVNCFLDLRDVAFYPITIFIVVSYWFS